MWLEGSAIEEVVVPKSVRASQARRLEPAPEAHWEPQGTPDHSNRTRFISRASRTRTRLNRSTSTEYLMICRKCYAYKGSILLNSGSDHGKPRRCFFLGSSLERTLYGIPVAAGIVSGRNRMARKR